MSSEPHIDRSITLDLVGDWGQATFHRTLSWLTQQFCDRAGPKSRTRIWSIRGAGVEAIPMVHDGEADLCVVTPAKLMPVALKGEGIFAQHGPMPHLKALAVLPQRDRIFLAVDPSLGIRSFEDLRNKRPALTVSTSDDDGSSFIGHVASKLLAAHGVDRATLLSWGGKFVGFKRPQQCLAAALDGTANAVLQEAFMLPHWNELIEQRGWIPLPLEAQALQILSSQPGYEEAKIPKDYWHTLEGDVSALDFSDFLIVVRDDMPDDVARLLTWCLVHTRHEFERQFSHMPPEKCPVTYPLRPEAMAKTSIELHRGARQVYQEIGAL